MEMAQHHKTMGAGLGWGQTGQKVIVWKSLNLYLIQSSSGSKQIIPRSTEILNSPSENGELGDDYTHCVSFSHQRFYRRRTP